MDCKSQFPATLSSLQSVSIAHPARDFACRAVREARSRPLKRADAETPSPAHAALRAKARTFFCSTDQADGAPIDDGLYDRSPFDGRFLTRFHRLFAANNNITTQGMMAFWQAYDKNTNSEYLSQFILPCSIVNNRLQHTRMRLEVHETMSRDAPDMDLDAVTILQFTGGHRSRAQCNRILESPVHYDATPGELPVG